MTFTNVVIIVDIHKGFRIKIILSHVLNYTLRLLVVTPSDHLENT